MKTQKIKILHVEDNHSDAELVAECLNNQEHLDYELTHAERLSEGIEHLKKNHFDVALLDLSLPDSQGVETIEHVIRIAPHLPIIALTGIHDNGLSVEALRAGAEDYLVKGKVDCYLLNRSIRYAIERKRTATLLRISEERYRTFFESSKDVFYRADINGAIQFVSQSVKNYGYSVEEVIGKDVSLFYQNPAYRSVFVQMLMAEKSVTDFEIELKRKDGTSVHASVTARLVLDRANKPIGIDGVLRDITERKEAESAIQLSEAKYKSIIENTSDMIYTYALDGTVTFISPNVARYGYTQEDIIGHNILEFVHPDDRERIRKEFEETIETGREFFTETRLLKKDGSFIYAEELRKITWIDGKPINITGNIRDITERKQAEELLRKSESKYKRLFDDDLTGNYISTPEGKLILCNPAFLKVFEFDSLDEALSFDYHKIYPKKEERAKLLDLLKRNKKVENIELELVTTKGKTIHVVENIIGEFDLKGDLTRYRGYIFDITARKQAEKYLRESQRQLSTLMRNLPGMVYRCSNVKDWSMEFVNDGCVNLTGCQPSDLINNNKISYNDLIHPDDRQMVWDTIQEATGKNQPFQITYRIIDVSGVEKWIWEHGIGVFSEDGSLLALEGFIADITERQRTEEALAKSEANFKAFMNNFPGLSYIKDSDGRVVFANEGFKNYLGMNPTDMLNKTNHDLFPLEFADKITEDDKRAIKAETYQNIEENFAGRTWSTYKFPIQLPDESTVLGGFTIDITERRKIEDALKESESRFREVVEEATENIFTTDHNGYFTYANPAALKSSGYSLEELTKLRYSDIVTDDYKRRVSMNYYRQFLNRAENTYTEYPFHTKSGEVRWFGQNARLITVNDEPKGFYLIARDVTERRKAEEALQNSEQQYRDLFENNPQPMWVYDRTTLSFVEVNEAAIRHYGYTREEFLSMTLKDIRPVEDIPLLLHDVASSKESFQKSDNWRHKKKDGTIIIVEITSHSIEWQNRPARIVIVRDITEKIRAEQALKESEEKYRSLFSRMMDGVYRRSHEGKFIEINDAMVKMFGYSNKEELLEVDINKDLYFEPSDGDSLFLDTGKEKTEIFRMRRKDGSEIWVEDHGQYIHDENGNVIFHEGILRDVTKRKRLEETLRSSEESYRAIFDNSVLGLYRTTPDGEIIIANPALCKMLGYSSLEELQQHNLEEEGFNPDYERTVFKDEIKKTGAIIALESSWKKKDGTDVFVSESAKTVKDSSGNVLYYEGTVEDITQRILSEQQVRLLSSALESAANSIVITNMSGDLIWANQSFSKLTGYQISEVIGKNLRVLKSGKHDETFYKILWETILSGTSWHGELINKRQDGTLYHEEMTITPVVSKTGEIENFIAIKQDITEKKLIETQLLRSQRMESIGTLASGIAHDLNNVLAPILLSLEILKKRINDNMLQKMIETMEISTIRGKDIIKQVLTFARGGEGDFVVIQPKHLIREMGNIMYETFPKSITVSIDISKDLWTISGDATQLHQLLLNLCVNARDAMPNGGKLTISAENMQLDEQYARMHVDARSGHYISITVSDTGIGIASEIIDKIFEPFYTTKEVGKGTGLGLSTAHSIVKNHKGFINVYSEIGKGSSFKIYLPASKDVDERTSSTVKSDLPMGNNETILVVDDEASILEITQQTLLMSGYRVINAVDGIEAIAKFAEHRDKINTVISDVMMPNLDGIATARTLKKMNPQLNIILTSGLKVNESSTMKIDFDIQAFLSKPYTAETLLRTLHRVINGIRR